MMTNIPKRILCVLLLLLSLSAVCAAEGPVQIGNLDHAGRLNLRSAPDKSAPVLGKYYAGVPAEEIETRGEWAHVSIFGRSGWVMRRYLLHPGDEGYAKDSEVFGVPGTLVRPQNFSSVGGVPLYTSDKMTSDICRFTESSQIYVLGVISAQLLHVRVILPNGADPTGYVPITEIGLTDGSSRCVVRAASPDQLINIRQQPSMNGRILGRLYPGAVLRPIFDWHNVDNGWQSVTFGGIFYGYVKSEFLDVSSTSTPDALMPFVRLKNHTAARYTEMDRNRAYGETNANAMLTAAGIFGDFCAVQAWDLFGGPHDYFFLMKNDLAALPTRGVSAWGTLTRDTPLMHRASDGSIVPWTEVTDGQPLRKGTQVLVCGPADFPGISPYVTGTEQWLSVEGTTFGGGMLPADAVELDTQRITPEAMTQG